MVFLSVKRVSILLYNKYTFATKIKQPHYRGEQKSKK